MYTNYYKRLCMLEIKLFYLKLSCLNVFQSRNPVCPFYDPTSQSKFREQKFSPC